MQLLEELRRSPACGDARPGPRCCALAAEAAAGRCACRPGAYQGIGTALASMQVRRPGHSARLLVGLIGKETLWRTVPASSYGYGEGNPLAHSACHLMGTVPARHPWLRAWLRRPLGAAGAGGAQERAPALPYLLDMHVHVGHGVH